MEYFNMIKKNKSLWFIIDHPGQVTNAFVLARELKQHNVNLLVSTHKYWKGIDFSRYFSLFSSVKFFDHVDFSWIFPREMFKILSLKKNVKKLPVNQGDVFIVFSNTVFLETILFSAFPNNKRILIYSDYEFEGYLEKPISKIWNFTLIPFFGLEKIAYSYKKSNKKMEMLFYKKGRERIFNQWFKTNSSKRQIVEKDRINDLTPLIPSVFKDLTSKFEDTYETVVFFGDSLAEFDEYHIDFVNRCLRYIESNFSGFKYIYKPHPNDKAEQQNIDLGKFELHTQKITTELFLIQKLKEVKCCFAVHSSSVQSALRFGIKSYFFYELYENFEPGFKALVKRLYSDIRKETLITSWSRPPQDYTLETDIAEYRTDVEKVKVYLDEI